MQNCNAKKLYMAKSLEELNKRIHVMLENNVDILKLCKSAASLLKSAENVRVDGDEEKSYVLYMRYIEFVLHIQKNVSNKKDREYCNSMLGASNIRLAEGWADKLSSSLQKRYEMLRCEEETSKRLQKKGVQCSKAIENGVNELQEKPVNVKDVHLRIDKFPLQPVVNGVKAPKQPVDQGYISCKQLYEYMQNKDVELLIMDTRPSEDFQESHIKHPCCFSIPAEIITQGITAPKLEPKLPSSSMSLWKKRGYVELIVLLDWSSSISSPPVGTEAISLKRAMYEYDTTTVIRSEPLVLSGGYESWLNYYPTFTTNSRVQKPKQNVGLSADDILVNCDYPDLDKAFIETPSQSSDDSFSNSPHSQMMIGDSGARSADTYGKTAFPSVDRTTKPKLAGSRSQGSVEMEPDHRPAIVELGSKAEPMLNDVHRSIPAVDRSAKPRIASSTKLPSDVGVPEDLDANQNVNVQKVVNLSREVTDADLELEKHRLKCEVELDKLRLQREMAAEEGMRLELQKQETALLEKIQDMEEEQKKIAVEKDLVKAENEKLRARIDELMKMNDEESQRMRSEMEAIRQKEQEKLKVEKEVNRLRLERRKKESSTGQRLEELHPSPRISPANSPKLRPHHFEMNSAKDNRISDVCESSRNGHSYMKLADDGASSKRDAFASRGLSRSQSFPNISQALDNEEALSLEGHGGARNDTSSRSANSTRSEFNTPLINRSVKPSFVELSAASNRNLMPVFGGQGRALTGLRNLGNSCYMNSIIQCLSNTAPLVEYFVSRSYKYDINRNNIHGHPGELVEEYAAIVNALHAGQYRCLSPKDFKRIVGKYQKMFDGFEQQDAQELLVFLMEYLHEDLNKADKNKAKELHKEIKSLEDSTLPVVTVGKKSWDVELLLNRSIFVELFQGQFISTVTCCHCNKVSNKFDTFSCVSLPIPSGVNKCNLRDCLQLFRKEEKMTGSSRWKCPRCKELREAKKRIDIYKLPRILLIHLKRFFYEGVWRKKLQTQVEFPVVDLDMREYVVGPEDRLLYNLYAVTNHYGTLDGGHYTAFCKNIYYKKWFKFDDHEVQEVSTSNLKSSAAYILYYTTQDTGIPDYG